MCLQACQVSSLLKCQELQGCLLKGGRGFLCCLHFLMEPLGHSHALKALGLLPERMENTSPCTLERHNRSSCVQQACVLCCSTTPSAMLADYWLTSLCPFVSACPRQCHASSDLMQSAMCMVTPGRYSTHARLDTHAFASLAVARKAAAASARKLMTYGRLMNEQSHCQSWQSSLYAVKAKQKRYSCNEARDADTLTGCNCHAAAISACFTLNPVDSRRNWSDARDAMSLFVLCVMPLGVEFASWVSCYC